MNKIGRFNFAAVSALLFATSCIEVRDPNADGPNTANLEVSAQSDPATAFEGGSVNLSATSEGGVAPLTFRWDQNSGPSVAITNPNSAHASVATLTEPGHYAFRVTVTDAAGDYTSDFVAIEVLEAVSIDAPTLAIVGQPVTLTAEISGDIAAPTLLWEVTQGSATFDDPARAVTHLTATRGETIKVRLTVSFASDVQSAATREVDIVAVPDLTPRVRVETNLGDFVIELDGENTPRHMINFLSYVDEGFYEGLLFHRNACSEDADTGECEPFVLQGGGYRREGDELVEVEPTREPVTQENESSQSNGVLYTVALALRGSPNSGTTQFFINLDEDNEFLDDDFTAFGLVVEDADVVDAMAATDRVESPILFGEESLPAEDIVIERIVRVE